MLEQIDRFIDAVEDVKTFPDLKEKFEEALCRIGFSHFAYLGMGMQARSGKESKSPAYKPVPVIISNFPKEWRERYKTLNYKRFDPVIAEVVKTLVPFSWQELLERESLSDTERKVLLEAKECGLVQGFTIPVFGPEGEVGLMSICKGEDRGFEERLVLKRHVLHVMTLYFHSMVQQILHAGSAQVEDGYGMTPRERECMKWTAEGKSAWEVSVILEISESTVKFHLKNAMKKMGVHSKAHAVAKYVAHPGLSASDGRLSSIESIGLIQNGEHPEISI